MSIVSISIPVSLGVCIIYVLSGLSLKSYTGRHQTFLPHESAVATLLGLVCGGLIKYDTTHSIVFSSDLFFYLVLPPIIFSAGYSLKRKKFFRYSFLISVFGILGTLLNFILIAVAARIFTQIFPYAKTLELDWTQAFLLASVLSASDEVAGMAMVRMQDYPKLGALIFGEGVLNDALSIVLFKSFYHYQAMPEADGVDTAAIAFRLSIDVIFQLLAAAAIGISCGLINAKLLKSFDQFKDHPIHETSLVLLFGLLAYSIAESFEISGILSLFLSAVTLAHYSWYNLSKPAQVSTKLSLSSMSDIAEGFAFAYIGLALWGFTQEVFYLPFAVYMLFVGLLARFFTIFCICQLGRIFSKEFEIPFNEQIGFGLGGMVRGCLSFAQILQVKKHKLLVSTTLFIVMVTCLAGGVLMPAVMPKLCPAGARHRNEATEAADHAQLKIQKAEQDVDPIENPDADLDSLDSDSDSNHNEQSEIAQRNHASLLDESAPSALSQRTYSALYVLWVWLDEKFMKTHFGGSKADPSRRFILREAGSLRLGSLPASITRIRRYTFDSTCDGDFDDENFDFEEDFLASLSNRETGADFSSAARTFSPDRRSSGNSQQDGVCNQSYQSPDGRSDGRILRFPVDQ